MKRFVVSTLLVVTGVSSALAEERCFQLSRSPATWSRTSERLCLRSADGKAYAVTFLTNAGAGVDAVVGRLELSLLKRVRCNDCNRDEFGIANPSNSVFNALTVRFDGRRDPASGEEQGALYVGQTRFAYRSSVEPSVEAALAPNPQGAVLPPPGPAPMEQAAFERLHATVKGSFNVDAAIALVRDAAATNWFTAEQAVRLVHDFPAPSFRYEPALALGRRLVDPQNRHLLLAEMLGNDANRLRDALR